MSRRARPWRPAAIAIALVGVCSCDSGHRAERREFEGLEKRIDDIRNADNAQKELHLDALAQAPCEAWCSLRQLCTSAYRLHLRALDSIQQAKRADPTEATEMLDEATALLEQARKQTTRCAARQGEIARRLRR